MSTSWLIALAVFFAVVAALYLWGPQLLAGVMRIAASAVWQAFIARAKGLETPAQMQKRVREGRERNDR